MASRLVYVVDDDAAIRESTELLLRIGGYQSSAFVSGVEFLAKLEALAPGCVLLDINMPELTGLEVQRAMLDRGIMWPTVIITAQGDIPVAVQAMKNGAFEFLEKPYESQAILATMKDAFRILDATTSDTEDVTEAKAQIAMLTKREREVFERMITGLPNKLIAYDLSISTRTVEIYRANVMAKLEVRSLAAAVRLGLNAGIQPPASTPQ